MLCIEGKVSAEQNDLFSEMYDFSLNLCFFLKKIYILEIFLKIFTLCQCFRELTRHILFIPGDPARSPDGQKLRKSEESNQMTSRIHRFGIMLKDPQNLTFLSRR